MSEAAGGLLIERIQSAAGVILGVSEHRSWIEVFFEGDLMHTRSVDLPAQAILDVYVEDIPHKATVCEYPRTTIYFTGPCDLSVIHDGDKIVITGVESGSELASAT